MTVLCPDLFRGCTRWAWNDVSSHPPIPFASHADHSQRNFFRSRLTRRGPLGVVEAAIPRFLQFSGTKEMTLGTRTKAGERGAPYKQNDRGSDKLPDALSRFEHGELGVDSKLFLPPLLRISQRLPISCDACPAEYCRFSKDVPQHADRMSNFLTHQLHRWNTCCQGKQALMTETLVL